MGPTWDRYRISVGVLPLQREGIKNILAMLRGEWEECTQKFRVVLTQALEILAMHGEGGGRKFHPLKEGVQTGLPSSEFHNFCSPLLST